VTWTRADLVARTCRPSGANARVACDAAAAELRRLIREGFEQDVSGGEKLAEAAALSVPRVCADPRQVATGPVLAFSASHTRSATGVGDGYRCHDGVTSHAKLQAQTPTDGNVLARSDMDECLQSRRDLGHRGQPTPNTGGRQ
jgi:hypothetical protein